MFGYVRIDKPEIKMGEYEQYKGIYCTLCRRLGKRYGLCARLSLSYDLTFLALLSMAMEEEPPRFCAGRCSFNPTKRCLKCQNTRAVDRAADLSVLFTHYKLLDTVADERGLKALAGKIALVLTRRDFRKAQKRLPAEDGWIAEMTEEQRIEEQKNESSVDATAEPFARLLSRLAQAESTEETQRRILARFGYCLGRWVYLADALDDLEKDRQKGNFNPYLTLTLLPDKEEPTPENLRSYGIHALNHSQAELLNALNLLTIQRFEGILRNICENGLTATARQIVNGKPGRKRKKTYEP